MDLKNSTSLFVTATALLLLAAAYGPTTADARAFIGVNPFCRTADYRRICTKMVNGATTLALAQRVQAMVPLLKPVISHLEPQSQESIMSTCNEDFDSRIDDLQESLKALEINDIGTVRTRLSAAFSSDCMEELSQFGVECPFFKIVEFLQKEVDNCLAVVQQN
ncbi:hypothetical protein ACJIZ3_010327 [Penstemon smallii]|uniref:Pectinesterase inhibitor domain-containing protein n=1 Tax=Penstemon smallii TaxID=265156 RepID=A0ABD3TG67_9LAMI